MQISTKKIFDDVVRENTALVVSIVQKYVKNPETVKDLTQEIFIRAYRSYDLYVEQGKIQSWLAMIARNKLKNYYKRSSNETNVLSLDYIHSEDSGSMNLYNLVSPEQEMPEDIVIRNEFVDRIINIINTLPPKQRDVIMYRYFYNYSIEEVSQLTNMSAGSIKSAGYYGLQKVKNLIDADENIGNNLNKNNKRTKGINNMNITAKEAYALLYEYAKGHVSAEDKIALEAYFETDEEAANIASALKQLHSKLTYARDDEMTHYNISVCLNDGGHLMYSNVSYFVEDSTELKELNEYLEKNDGYLPADNRPFQSGANGNPACAVYDNEGNKLEIEIYYPNDEGNDYHRSYVKRTKKIFSPVFWKYAVYYYESDGGDILYGYEELKTAPNLYKAYIANGFGNNTTTKSALYAALPPKATNIRMMRGNGVLDCGTYKFAYVDRYVWGDEMISAECTFNV